MILFIAMKLLTNLLALLLLSFSASAASAVPLPPSATIRPADPLAGGVERTLPNGLRVVVQPRRTAPVVTTMMWYRVGSRDELPGATGIAHFLEHLMFKGTRRLGKGAIDRLTYQNGGTNNAFTSYDYTAYEFNLPRRNWKVALAIEADRMRNCVFDAREFEAERQVVMEERRGGEDDPAERFDEQLNAMAFLAHPYRNPVIGWMEDLKRVTREEVIAFYRKYYVPANAVLVIAGDVTPEEAVGAARAAFASVPKLPAPSRRAVVEPAHAAERRLRLSLPTRVARLQVLFPAPARGHADLAPMELLAYALAEGKQSRLHRRLVDRDRLAAEVDGALYDLRDAGQLAFSASAAKGASLDRLETALWEELERLAREPLAEKELRRAKNQFQADRVQSVETANDLAAVVGEAEATVGRRHLTAFPAAVERVTPEDVRRVAALYLRRDRATIGHLHPEETAESARGGARSHRAARGTGAPRFAGRAYRRMPSRRPFRTSSAAPASFAPLRPLEKVLPNGMRLVLLENRTVPSVVVSARVAAGSLREPDAQAGLAALTARMLDQGVKASGADAALSYEEVNETLEQVGAAFEAAAGRTGTLATLRSVSKYSDGLLPLFARLLRSPSFPEERLEQERERSIVALREEADDPGLVARKAFYELVYAGHPARRPVSGYEETVSGLDRRALAEFHARHFQPRNMTLVAVGDFEAAELMQRLTRLFEGWENGPEPVPAPVPELKRQDERRVRRIPLEKTQTQVLLGHLGVTRTNPDYTALRVMDMILGEGVGGGFTARIPYQLRDVQGLAYGVGSSITGSAGAIPGVFAASIATDPKNEAKAVAALLKEIARIRSEPVTDEELRDARRYLSDSYLFEFQTSAQLAGYLHAVLEHRLGYDFRRRFVDEVGRITRADVLRAARKYLDPEGYTLVVVGPQEPVR